jgi:hypothetical protein
MDDWRSRLDDPFERIIPRDEAHAADAGPIPPPSRGTGGWRAVAAELLTSPLCWTCYLALFVMFGSPLLFRSTPEHTIVDRFAFFLVLLVFAALIVLVFSLILQLVDGAVGAARALIARIRGDRGGAE